MSPESPPRPGHVQPWELGLVAGLLLLGGALRLGELDLIELKADEVTALRLGHAFVEQGRLPLAGLYSSVGVRNPPALVYAISPALLLFDDPRWVTGLSVGGSNLLALLLLWWVLRRRAGPAVALCALALFAAAPWAVLYARKIWAQDLLALPAVLLFALLLRLSERPNTRAVAALPPLLSLLVQLHYSALTLGPVCLLLLLRRAKQLHLPALGLGLLLAGLSALPFALHLQRGGLEELSLAAQRATPAVDEPAGAQLLRHSVAVAGGTDFAAALGPSLPRFETERAPHCAALARGSGWLAGALFALGLLAALGRLLGGMGTKVPLDPANELRLVALVWTVGVWGGYLLLGLEQIHPHYLIVLYPAPFVLAATGLQTVAARIPRPLARHALAPALIGLLLAGQLSALWELRGFLRRHGGTAGDYGVIYRHKAAAIDHALTQGLALRQAPGPEYGYLFKRALKRTAKRPCTAPPNRCGLYLADTLRRPELANLRCPGRRRFGPLVACQGNE